MLLDCLILHASCPCPIRCAPKTIVCRETWRETDSTTIFGRRRSPASDALSQDDDYTVLDIEVISRALEATKARSEALELQRGVDPDDLCREGFAFQAARRGTDAEAAFLAALASQRSCGAAWYGLASLLHEYQHGGLDQHGSWQQGLGTKVQLAHAADAALIAARYEPQEPRSLALLGDVLNDLGDHREACRAWTAAEKRGQRYWRSLATPWVQAARGISGKTDVASRASAFGPREPLRSLTVGLPPLPLKRASTGRAFTAQRLAYRPSAFLLSGFSSAAERSAIVAAAEAAPLRAVPRAESDASVDDDRRGCEVAWLSSPVTSTDTPWADLMNDAIELVLPKVPGLPDAGPAEDLHVVKYGPGGAYGLHLDASYAVPRAVVRHNTAPLAPAPTIPCPCAHPNVPFVTHSVRTLWRRLSCTT